MQERLSQFLKVIGYTRGVLPQTQGFRRQHSFPPLSTECLLRTKVRTEIVLVTPSWSVPWFWNTSDLALERMQGPPWLRQTGKVFDPILGLACWTHASFRCGGRGSPSVLRVSNLTVVYFSELTALKTIKVRT